MAYVGWIDTFEGGRDLPLKYHAESEIIRELESLGAVVIAKVSHFTLSFTPLIKKSTLPGSNTCVSQH